MAAVVGPEHDGMMPNQKIENYAAGNHSEYGVVYQLGALTWWGFSLILSIVVAILWFPVLQVSIQQFFGHTLCVS